MNWYLHNHYEGSEIQEQVAEEEELTPEAAQTLYEELYNLFYEVKFNVEYDKATGKITKVVLDPCKHGQKGIFQ
jgi:hypothetical protein